MADKVDDLDMVRATGEGYVLDEAALRDQEYRRYVNRSVCEVGDEIATLAGMGDFDDMFARLSFNDVFLRARIRAGDAVTSANNRNWKAAKSRTIATIFYWMALYRYTRYTTMGQHLAETILAQVGWDIDHHFDKHGYQRLDLANWQMVLGEEEGEAISAYFADDMGNARQEIMQVIACWIRFYAELGREASGVADQERALYERAV